MQTKLFICVLLTAMCLLPTLLFSQAAEINPYAGYFWPGSNDGVGEFRGNQLLGVRGGFYITPSWEVGGNYAWNNHFQPESDNTAASFAGALGFPQGKVRAHLWEAEFTYNFGKKSVFGSSVRPYLVAGTGALRTSIKDTDEFVLNVRQVIPPCGCRALAHFVPNDVLESGDTFFTFSYGGGLKAHRLWGPMGVFGDFRGRTIPNFFGHGTNAAELSAGLTFSWGER